VRRSLSLRTRLDRLDAGVGASASPGGERERCVALPLSCRMSLLSELESGAGGHHRRAPGAHGGDDLLGVERLQVDRCGAEIRVPELALDDVERHPSRASSSACACLSWCGAKRRLTPARAATRRNSLRTAAAAQGRPRVGPSITLNSGPTGSSTRAASQGRSCSQPHSSMPTSRRRPPLPLRTSSEPRRWSRSCSARASASWTRSPARHNTTISPRSL
jgi:hypothetical protein